MFVSEDTHCTDTLCSPVKILPQCTDTLCSSVKILTHCTEKLCSAVKILPRCTYKLCSSVKILTHCTDKLCSSVKKLTHCKDKLCSSGNILVSFSHVSSIKTFDFSTRYTILPHDKLKTRLRETTHKAFSHRNDGSKCVVLGYNSTYFSNKVHKGKTCYSEEQMISMLEFLIDNICVYFGGALFSRSSACQWVRTVPFF
jgi:hypothetical protein